MHDLVGFVLFVCGGWCSVIIRLVGKGAGINHLYDLIQPILL